MEKLCFIWLAKEDYLMLLNNQFKAFGINLNTQNADGMTSWICTVVDLRRRLWSLLAGWKGRRVSKFKNLENHCETFSWWCPFAWPDGSSKKIRKKKSARFARAISKKSLICKRRLQCCYSLKTFKVCLLVFLDEIWGSSSIATSHL